MYITETTGKERQTISNAMYGIMSNVQRAERVTRKLWDGYFSSETSQIGAYELEDIADIIHMVSDSLYDACLEYAMMVNEEYCGIEKCRESAENACLAYKVDMLRCELMRSVKDSNTKEKIKETLELSDKEAIKILETIKGENR